MCRPYRPPRDICDNYQQFNDEFTDILHRLQKTKGEIAIVGDYNIDLLKVEHKPIIRDYLDSLMTQGFFPKITLPTRFSDLNGTLIDNVICRLSNTYITNTAGIIVTQISDHLPYFVCINNLKVKKTVPIYIYIKQNSDRSIHKFKAEVKQNSIYDQLNCGTDANPCSNYDILDKIISEAADRCMPSKRVKYNKHKHKKSQWITGGIIRSIKFRDKMYANMKQTPANTEAHVIIKTNLKTYNNILRHSIAQAKTIYYQQKLTKYTNDIRNTWKVIKEVTNKTTTKTQLPEFFKVDGKILTEKKDIANKFNTFFTNIGPSLASKLSATGNKTYKDYLNTPCIHKFTFSTITESEVIKTIDKLPSKTSSGVDGISTVLLKHIKHEISKPVTLILNQCLATGIFPDKLKIAKVVPIYKSEDDNIFNNYRPISVLPALSKVFEKIIFNQTYSHFDDHNLFFGNQYGFRKKHSTELAVLEVIDRITNQLDKGQTPMNIYLDLSKAFDTLDHDILINKLQYYGVHGSALRLFKNYLTERKQYVIYNETPSELGSITTGVPQGSILGPLLFIIYINDIAQSTSHFNFITYADDTTLCGAQTRHNDAKTTEHELNKVTEWLKINKLSLNVKKTKAMVFHMPQKKVILPILRINGTIVEFVDNFVFLGIQINKHLNWNHHNTDVANKIVKTVGILNILKIYLPLNVLRIIYNSLILPHLNYGILLWGHQAKQTKQIQVIQKRAVRILTGSKYNSHTEPLFKQINLLKVNDICKLNEIKFYYKLVHKQQPQYFNSFTHEANSDIHGHNTRSRDKLHFPKTKHDFAKINLRYRILQTINVLPETVTSKVYTHIINGVTNYAKQYFISGYKKQCTIGNCYICQHTI